VAVDRLSEAEQRAERARQRAASALAEAVRHGGPVLGLVFAALGPHPTRRELVLVAQAIRDSGDEEAHALFGASSVPDPDPVFDHEACTRVQELADRAGVDGFVALNLYTEVTRPGWVPFPSPAC
jgi:hypothetical protein